ncbi:homoserine dehydrogenase [Sphaerobacter sp.]|uniref:homoserine dehydrogenase n=1 Tax=Sphaerobacter sp. TaxID=2099654 RepID=UPI001DF4AEF2|nr:homoserine dehydrogenase [Sphaerobacter sp.]MBX5445886.1 homoserine dehydrogenase [Sphaerobacter sp.]
MNDRQFGVAILGLGTIGSAVARAIREQGDLIAERYGLRLVVQAVLERSRDRAARADLPPDTIATDLATILSDDGVDVVVEVLGGEQPAADFMLRCLRAGKHVVTANKEALAKHFGELTAAAKEAERALLFEASVGGGIPLLVSYRQILAANRITRVRGIVNGTTNFILSQMAEHGTAYDAALAEAQRLGYAEPDPTADVEGYDAAYKLAILASLMLGRHVSPDEVDRTGITGVTAEEVAAARERGGAIKLIASAERDGDDVRLQVAPTFVPGDNLLAHVSANFNAIELTGDRVGPVVLSGQGAGPLPTASAILSDVVEAARVGAAANVVLGS